jgi:catechol 2,3-dioxygenase-like lactoylglutathione lyase family enzyme
MKYTAGIHHVAFPTTDPKAILDFYVGTMGATVPYCITCKGWGADGYPDYIHMFIDIGRGANLAMFYFFGVEDVKDAPPISTHISFGADTMEDLDHWESHLRESGEKVIRLEHEAMTSLYVKTPTGAQLEIAHNLRPLNQHDAIDGQLTAEALCRTAGEETPTIERMWEHKSLLVQERIGRRDGTLLFVPLESELEAVLDGVDRSTASIATEGSFHIIEGKGNDLRISRPSGLRDSLWAGAGTGGIQGSVIRYDHEVLELGT